MNGQVIGHDDPLLLGAESSVKRQVVVRRVVLQEGWIPGWYHPSSQ